MIKLNLVCVGKLKEKFYADAVAEYCKRLARFADVRLRELPEKRTIAEEGPQILRELRGYSIALAVEGQKMSSEAFAEKIGRSWSFVAKIESPTRAFGVSMDTLFRIAEVLQIPASKLFED